MNYTRARAGLLLVEMLAVDRVTVPYLQSRQGTSMKSKLRKKWPASGQREAVTSSARWSEPVSPRRAGRVANSGQLRIKTTGKFCGRAGIAAREW